MIRHASGLVIEPHTCIFAVRKANVAQLVEQLIRNEQVTGSSPVIGSKAPRHSVEGAFFYHA